MVFMRLRPMLFQSTRPRGARQCEDDVGYRVAAVSIHAPARGATGTADDGFSRTDVSIHAPARGATLRMMRVTL